MTETAAPLDAHLGYWLRLVSNHVSQRFARQVEAKGVTVAEWVLLRALFDHDTQQPSALADTLGLTRGAISKLADRLQKKSLLAREADDDDRRAHRLRLTQAGRALVPQLAALADENDARFFAALSEKDRAALAAMLRQLARAHDLKQSPID
ncbi:MAG: Transcriptional regulator [Alphaproteobacteria bacterium]|jgi:DNA-binding MarR family transcriptional regulator|nr:Transcriptional regulator [Alphaproteobacteria bacterium]